MMKKKGRMVAVKGKNDSNSIAKGKQVVNYDQEEAKKKQEKEGKTMSKILNGEKRGIIIKEVSNKVQNEKGNEKDQEKSGKIRIVESFLQRRMNLNLLKLFFLVNISKWMRKN